MKVCIYNAISIDGFIADEQGDTSWVNDVKAYEKELSKNSVVIYGRVTYEDLVALEQFPFENIKNVILTSKPKDFDYRVAEFTDLKPEILIKQLVFQGHENILIAGGGLTNSTFLETDLVDEIIVDIHPIILSSGVKLFDDLELKVNLELLKTKKLNDGIVQHRYKIVREEESK